MKPICSGEVNHQKLYLLQNSTRFCGVSLNLFSVGRLMKKRTVYFSDFTVEKPLTNYKTIAENTEH